MRCIFLLICLSVSIANAQVISIADEETGLPLEMVTIVSEAPAAFEVTNAKGQADISAFSEAEKIEIRMLGYETEELSYSSLKKMGFALQMKSSGISIDVVVVSANRWNQNARDVPSKIISVSKKEVALQNPQTAADLLAVSGAVFVQKSQQGGGSPMIRGFATNRLLYAIDGVRMNTAIFRGGNLQNVISLDPFAIESTEVLFGPGSVMYGSDAIGGVMSFQTLKPQLSLNKKPSIGGKALFRYASASQEKTGHFDVNIGWKRWAAVSSISYTDYSDLKMGSHGPEDYLKPYHVERQDSVDVVVQNKNSLVQTPSAYSQINLMQKLRFIAIDKLDLQYGFHYSETSEYGRYDRSLRTRKNLPRYGEWKYGPQKWLMHHLDIAHNSNNKVYDKMHIRLAQQKFEESRISRDFNKANRETRIEKVQAYSANIDFSKAIGTRNILSYGLEAVFNMVQSTGIDENIFSGLKRAAQARYPESTWASYAVYASNQFKLSEKVVLQAGIRYNYIMLNAEFDTSFYPFPFQHAKLNNGATTGSFGVVYRPNKNWSLSSNLATAFRSPNIDDMAKVFDSEQGSVVIPNPDLKSEYAYSVDIGIAKVFGNRLKVDATAYYTYLKNALVRRDFQLNGADSIMYAGVLSQVQAMQNAATANVYGLQAGFELKLPAGFSIASNLNYQKGVEELANGEKSSSRHAAPIFGVSKLNFYANKLSLQFYVNYSGQRKFADLAEEEQGKTEIYAKDENGNPWAPRWYTLNFKAQYQIFDFLTINAGVENLSDQRYRPYSSGITAPGRNFIISLKANF